MAREFSKAFYNSKEWKNVRKSILMRDKYLCVKCSAPAEEVHHVEHLTPFNIGDISITMNPDNLISLCKECHFAEHKKDKIDGIKKAHSIIDCDNDYVFDENGYLVRNA